MPGHRRAARLPGPRPRAAAARAGVGTSEARPGVDASDARSSRARVFAAAAREFAARGFAGTSVDRIAAAARLNKAMIYYHFRSKRALYTEILRDMFSAVGARVRELAASDAAPDEKVRGFVDALALEAEARPHFPAIWFREIAEGGAHLDEAIVRDVATIVATLGEFVTAGVRARVFQPVNPLLVHAGIVGPLLLYFASAPLRIRLGRTGRVPVAGFTRDEVVRHVERVALGVLTGRV